MTLASFKELLLKKSEGNDDLQTLIRFVDPGVLSEFVMETLEKMARGRHKGDAANQAVLKFGETMDADLEPHMIREALGHHVSHYKAALDQLKNASSDGEKKTAKGLADQHARQAFKLMNLADTVKKHTQGKLNIDYVPPQPWERNKFTSQYEHDHPLVQQGKYKPGDFTTKTKGLNYKGSIFDNDGNNFLEQAPHEAYSKEIKRHGHNGAYPFEHTKINGKYIPVEDVKDKKGYEAHPFDHHPILSHFRDSAQDRTDGQADARYMKEHDDYASSHHVEKFWNDMQAREESDPASFAQRGSKPSDPVHAAVENPLDISQPSEPPKHITASTKLQPGDIARAIQGSAAIPSRYGRSPQTKTPSESPASPEASSTAVDKPPMTLDSVKDLLRQKGFTDEHIARMQASLTPKKGE